MPFSSSVASSAFSAEKQMPFRPLPSSRRSLSFAVTTATLRTLFGETGEHGRGDQVLRIVHQHFGAAVAIEKVVAANAMHRGRHAGHDRQVVRVREARHHAFALERRAGTQQLGRERARLPPRPPSPDIHTRSHPRRPRRRVCASSCSCGRSLQWKPVFRSWHVLLARVSRVSGDVALCGKVRQYLTLKLMLCRLSTTDNKSQSSNAVVSSCLRGLQHAVVQ